MTSEVSMACSNGGGEGLNTARPVFPKIYGNRKITRRAIKFSFRDGFRNDEKM